MHPAMRELLGRDWTARKRTEFRVYRALIRIARRMLPKRLVLEPLAYNRYCYEKLRGAHTRFELESFAVPA